jgi:hypothetical protein
MTTFDYAAKVDLFVTRGSLANRRPLEYRSFSCASEAIRYAIEEVSPERSRGICMETDELRFDNAGIRKLYESEAYPLERKRISRAE